MLPFNSTEYAVPDNLQGLLHSLNTSPLSGFSDRPHTLQVHVHVNTIKMVNKKANFQHGM